MNCYCDASYNHNANIGVIGYKFNNEEILYESYSNIKNTQLELLAIQRLIEKRDKEYINQHIYIYTDCQKACQIIYPNVTTIKIKAHKKKSDCIEIDKINDNNIEMTFRNIDIGCRTMMKNIIKNNI
jgi:hypothetical protein